MCLQLDGAFSGLRSPNFSHKCKCRALDTRARPKKRVAASAKVSFSATRERSQDAAHLCVRVPLIFSEEHHSNCSFALTQPQPCMQLGELCSLVPRKSTQWPQDLLPGADGCWGWGCILDTAWTAQLDNKAVFPTAMAHSQSHYPALWDSLGTPSLQHQGGLPTNQREMHGPRYQTSLKVHS